jgi:ABC-type dipeptide/oligopeptide/nickel transport system permease component
MQLLCAMLLASLHVVKPGGALDHAIGAAGLVLASVPTFWLSLVAILLLAVAIPIFPPSSAHSIGSETWSLPARAVDVVWHAALPALVLGWAPRGSSLAFCAQAWWRLWVRGSSARRARAARRDGACSRPRLPGRAVP